MAEIIPFIQLEYKIDFLRKRKTDLKVIATNGCFDIVHIGHIRYLQKAKTFGDILVVGVNSDDSVKRLKGESRPINNESVRAEFLAALECIDIVSIFDEDTASSFLKKVKPSIYIKGGDYSLENLPERETIEALNISLITIPMVTGFSTTKIIEQIKSQS